MKEMRHHNSLTWPRNAGNSTSEDLNFKSFTGEDVLPLDVFAVQHRKLEFFFLLRILFELRDNDCECSENHNKYFI